MEGGPAASAFGSSEIVISSSANMECAKRVFSMKVAFASEALDPVGRPQCQQNRYFDSITELQ